MKFPLIIFLLPPALALTVSHGSGAFLDDEFQRTANTTMDDEVDHGVEYWSGVSKYGTPVQYFWAGTWVIMIASLPTVVPLVNRKRPTNSQMIVGCIMVVVFFGGLLLFTNIILFQSVHFKTIRPLTLIECMYFMSQVITTVGYGDITPAKVRGQVFVGIYVLGAMFVISMVVSDVVNQLIESADNYKKHLRESPESADHQEAGDAAEHEEDMHHQVSTSSVQGEKKTKRANTRKGQRLKLSARKVEADSIEHMLCLTAPSPPPAAPLFTALAAFAVIDIIWIAFFSLNPDEKKTVFQALYMSVITLSSVGFGWFTPLTEEGMIFGAYFMIFGCAALVNVITQFTELMMKLNEYERNCELVKSKHDEAAARLEENSTGGGVSEKQFLEFCLLQMKCVQPEQLEQIQEAFKMVQTDGYTSATKIRKDLLQIPDEPKTA